MNVLITGAGGDIGQSIGRILADQKDLVDLRLGSDIHEEHAGKFIFDQIVTLPRANSNEYLNRLDRLIQEYKIDIIMPGSEPEIRFLVEHDITEEFNRAKIVLADHNSLEIGLDKLRTARFLEKNGFNYPVTEIAGELENPSFPGVLKSRTGSGSSSVILVEDLLSFQFFANRHPDFVFQEFVGSDDQEYTCGLFRNQSQETASVTFRRKLKDGITVYGEIISNQAITELLHGLGERLNLCGSINVQLRLTSKGPIVFEINPRFSSTVRFRHLLGFHDVLWSIKEKMGIPYELDFQSPIGSRIYRGLEEFVE